MRIVSVLALATAAAASPSSSLSKRCSPAYDSELARGYYPPAPCWQTFNPACQPFLAPETEMTLDAKHSLAVVYGVSDSCAVEIAEELAREAVGRKNYGWVRQHGNLTFIKGGILVISNMTADAVQRYSKLTYETRA